MKKKVSVIIPVWGGADYVPRCLDSVINQSLREIEIILILDGPPRSVEDVCDEYKKRDKRIKMIKQVNQGQSVARNNGLKIAKGEFIFFVDDDDFIDEDMLEKMYKTATEKNYDIILCGYKEIYKNYNKDMFNFSEDKRLSSKDFFLYDPAPWGLLINRKLMNDFKFPEGFTCEDLATIPLLAFKTNKFFYIHEALYNYNCANFSTMRKKIYDTKLEDIFYAIDYLVSNLKKIGKYDLYKDEIEYINISHLLLHANGRFLSYKKGIPQIYKIATKIKADFPNWKDNRYYKKMSLKNKMLIYLFYNKKINILTLLLKIKKRLGRGI